MKCRDTPVVGGRLGGICSRFGGNVGVVREQAVRGSGRSVSSGSRLVVDREGGVGEIPSRGVWVQSRGADQPG